MPFDNDGRVLDFLSGCVLAMQTLGEAPLFESLPRALQRLTETASLDRAGVYAFRGESGKRATLPSLVAEHQNTQLTRDREHSAYPRIDWSTDWYSDLAEDRVVTQDLVDPTNLSANPPSFDGPSHRGRCRSLVAVPIDVSGELWGFLRLDFVRSPIRWTEQHDSVARSFARYLGALQHRALLGQAEGEGLAFSLEQLSRDREISFELDHGGNWSFLSPAWDRLTGYSAARVLGSHHSHFLFRCANGNGSELEKLDLRGLAASAARSTGEALLKTEDGSHIWVSYLISPGARRDGENPCYQGVLADIQDRKVQEERERASALELQRKNHELLTALMAAQEATRLQGNFLATMSHEIRTPLNGVLGMTSLLLQTSLDRQQKEYARAIQSSAESLLSIVNSILDYSKLEAHRVEIEEVHYDPRDVVEAVCASLAEPAARKRIDLVVHERYPMPVDVLGDPGKVRQVLMNLVGNAIKFSKRGEVGIVVTWEPLIEPAGELRFEVIDFGIGMAPETLDRLFRPFSQAEPSTSRLYGGTGLGLAISKQLCELMGGQIFAQSQLGVGSRFQVVLRATGSSLAQNGWRGSAEIRHLRGKRAILSGFGELSAQAWFRALAECEVVAQRTQSLRDTVEILSKEEGAHPTDLVVLDTQALDGGGPEINRAIRLASKNPHLFLVLLDSVHDPVDRSVLKGVDPLLVLRKPVSPYRALCQIASAQGAVAQTPRKPIQRQITVHTEELTPAAPALLFAATESRRRGLAYLLRQAGLSVLAAEDFSDLLQQSLNESLGLVFLDAGLGMRNQVEVAQKLRAALGGAAPPMIAVAESIAARTHLMESGLFDAVLEMGFQRSDLKRVVEQFAVTPPSAMRASAC
jgi:PAS domain S-box-containing protein